MSDEELSETVEFDFISDDDHSRMTKAEILAHIITHGASHRGAIGKMLETLKVKGAPDMMTSFVSTSAALAPELATSVLRAYLAAEDPRSMAYSHAEHELARIMP